MGKQSRNIILNVKENLEATELLRQRHLPNGLTEYLVRWHLYGTEKKSTTAEDSSSSSGSLSDDSKSSKDVFLWMTSQEFMVCCPHLCTTESTSDQAPCPSESNEEKDKESRDTFSDVEDLDDMRLDVIKLVGRARKQMYRMKKDHFHKPLSSLSQTIKVLSTYAGLGSLAGVFRETGALDLILELLWTNDVDTRRAAGRMLRALALHDAGSRAYVLLSLTQDQPDEDGDERRQHYADFENRAMVMEMFAETASGEEAHAVALDSVQMPQVPGKSLFTLMKCYLGVASLMDSNNYSEGDQNQQKLAWMHLTQSSSTSDETAIRQFELAMAISDLIYELNVVMDWNNNTSPSKTHRTAAGSAGSSDKSISPPPTPTLGGNKLSEVLSAAKRKRRKKKTDVTKVTEASQRFKTPRSSRKPLFVQTANESSVDPALLASLIKSDQPNSSLYRHPDSFESRRHYTEYVQREIRPGIRVRACQSYEDVTEGDEGVYRQHNDTTPPVQVYWKSLERTYWVYWHHIVLLGDKDSSHASPPSFLAKPQDSELWPILTGMRNKVRSLYGVELTTDAEEAAGDTAAENLVEIPQRDWWVLLFYVSKLSKKGRDTTKQYLCQKFPNQSHMSLMSVTREDGLNVMTEILKDVSDKEKDDMRNSCICDELITAIEKEQQMKLEIDEKKNEVSCSYPLPTGKDAPPAAKPSSSESGAPGSDEKLPGTKDDVNAEEKAKAVEMGLRMGLIVDEETEKIYYRLFLDKENYELANRLWKLQLDTRNSLKLSKVVSKYRRAGRIISLTALKSLATNFDSETMPKQKDMEDVFSNILSAADDTDHLVVSAYLQFVLICLHKSLEANVESENLQMILATSGHLKAIFDIIVRFPDEHSVISDAIQCIYHIMDAGVFAKNPALNQDSAFIHILTAIITSIMATSDSVAPSSSDQTDSEKRITSIVLSYLNAVERLITEESKMSEPVAERNAEGLKHQVTVYNALCVLWMIARKDQSKSLMAHSGFVEEIIGAGLKCPSVGSNSRRMLQRLKGLIFTMSQRDVLELEQKDIFGSDDSDDEDEGNEDTESRLIIAPFLTPNLDTTSKEDFASHISMMKDATTDEIRTAAATVVKDLVFPVLRGVTSLASECRKCVANLKNFLVEFEAIARDNDIVLFETHWATLVSVLVNVLELSNSTANKSLSLDVASDTICALQTLSELDKDFTVFLCGLEANQCISRLLEKHTTMPNASALRDSIASCERQRNLHNKLLAVVLGGCISTALHCIEDARRQQKAISVPFFDQLLNNLCKGADLEVKEEKCWERLEVSSNSRQLPRLTDGNSKSYWESNGSSGAHWINVFMKKGIVARKVTVLVAQEDSSYMPSRIAAYGGNTSSDVTTQLSHVNVGASDTEVVVLENARRFWPVIRISIRRCQQGGIDTRIHGIEVVGPKPSFWPLLRRQLYIRTSLMYTVQVYSWIADEEPIHDLSHQQLIKHKILDVPNRLLQAINFEQEFADNYLPNHESALVLGQACRSSLSHPILEYILARRENPDGSKNISLMGHMLNAYLHCNENGSPTFESLLFSSKLRRLLRLIVDLDKGASCKTAVKQKESEQAGISLWSKKVQPHGGKSARNEWNKTSSSDSTTSDVVVTKDTSKEDSVASADDEALCEPVSHLPQIAMQWSETVEAHMVKMFQSVMADCDKASSVEDCLNLLSIIFKKYDFLRKCGSDLFGSSSQFSVVLAAGVWKAIISIDLECKKKLCCIINVSVHYHILCESAPDITVSNLFLQLRNSFKNLHQWLCLTAGSDFCLVFEQLYAKLLSLRLQRGGEFWSNVDVEKRICQLLQPCFPNHKPNDMLEDEVFSSNLNSRFLSNCLEQCDAAIASNLHSNKHMWIDNFERFNFISNGGFFASVYRPGTWSSGDLGPVFTGFPMAKLDPRLHRLQRDFESFFRKERIADSSCTFSSEKPSLVWTRGGYGILHDKKNNVDLSLSTDEMIFLLSFNDQIELEITVPCNALKSLLRKKIVYEAKADTYKVHDVITCDTDHPDDEGELLAMLRRHCAAMESISERRRNLIDAKIMRLMKTENQCTIDCLVQRVLQDSAANRRHSETERATSADSGHCEFLARASEVRARCDYLLNTGYLHRKPNTSHVIMYNEEDETQEKTSAKTETTVDPDQPNTAGQKSPIGDPCNHMLEPLPKSDSVPQVSFGASDSTSNDKPDVNTSTSATESYGNLEVGSEVEALPSPKMTSSETLVAECEGKGSGTNHPAICQTEDKTPADFLTLDIIPTTMTSSQLLNNIRKIISQVASVLSEDADVAEALLLFHEWDVDKVIESHLGEKEKSDSSIRSTSLSDGSSLPESNLVTHEKENHCPVCLNPIAKSSSYSPPCHHVCCLDCWKTYLNTKIEQDKACSATCPVGDCHSRLTTKTYSEIFKDNAEVIEKYNEGLIRSFVESSRSYSWCHNPKGCNRILRKSSDGRDEGWCSSCGWQTCFHCTYVESHYPASCSHMSQWTDDGGFYEGMDEDARSKNLARLIAKRCPNCQANIEKNDGCLHMKCAKCGHDFCWRCLEPWQPTHQDYFNCSNKASKLAQDSKKFVEFNKRCEFHQKAKQFAYSIRDRLMRLDLRDNLRNLKFSLDLCTKLAHSRRILAYCNIFSFYSTDREQIENMQLHSAALEKKTLALQRHLYSVLLSCADIQYTVTSLTENDIEEGCNLMRECDAAILVIAEFSKQGMKVGHPDSKEITSKTGAGTLVQLDNHRKSMAINARPGGMSEDDSSIYIEASEHTQSDDDDSDDDVPHNFTSDDEGSDIYNHGDDYDYDDNDDIYSDL